MTARHGHLPRALLVAADVAAALVACVAAYVVRVQLEIVPVAGRTDVLPARYLEALPIAVTVMIAAVALAGLYERRHLGATPREADALRTAVVALAMLSTAALLYWRTFQYSRLTIVIAALLFAPAFLAARAIARRLLARLARSARYRSAAVVVGGGAPAAALARALASQPWMAIDVVAVVPVGEAPGAWPGAARLADVAAARALLESGGAREVFVAVPATEAHRVPPILGEMAQTQADVRVVPDLGGALTLNPSAAVVGGLPVVSVRERPLYGLRAAGQRALDVALAPALLVLLCPVFVPVTLAVALTSRGPVLFRQERRGLDGRPFRMLKFRTMRADAESVSGPVFATPGDPRVTSLGRVLRRLSLDELPQLVNVLRGQMSLVGPRPLPLRDHALLEDWHRARALVLPGMTGLWQISGRSGLEFDDLVRLDFTYIENWSIWSDVSIIARTIPAVISGRGAY